MKNKNLKLIIAIILAWSAPIISFIIWLWLMHKEKYQEYSIPKKTMWIVFWITLSPIIVGVLGVAAIDMYDSISPLTKEANDHPTDVTYISFPSILDKGHTYNADIERMIVHDEKEFIECLGSNRELVIPSGIMMRMDKILSDSSFYSRGLIEKSSGWQHYDTYSPKIYNEYIDQYNELALCNFENLTIRAVDECTFVVDSTRSYIIKFINCKNITLENLCFNHRQSGFSNRGSIGISSCAQVRFRNIETKSLLGNGIVIWDSEEIEISDSYLTNARGSQVRIENSSKVRFNDCAFLRNNTALYVDYNSKDVSLNKCEFINNLNTLFELNSIITLNTCEIQHKLSDLGDLDDAQVMFVNNTSNIRPCIDKYLVNEYLRENSPAVGVEIIDSISTKNGLASILGVKLPEYRIEVSEYMDVDSIPVKVVECYMHPKIEEEQWEDLNSAIINAQAQYVPENQPDITRRGWTSAENMNIPAHVNENTQVRIETSNKYEQKITIEYRANPNDKYSTKEAVSNLISSKLGLNILTTDFEITSYIKDFHVVLKLNENAMNKILSIVRKSDSWGGPRYAPEGHHAYYDYDNKWQAEIHEDTYMLQLSRSWNIYGEYNY